MNEKLKEIIDECYYTKTDYSLGIDSSTKEFDKEIFAELLVSKCANIASELQKQQDFDIKQNFYNKNTDKVVCSDIGILIKEYFGILK